MVIFIEGPRHVGKTYLINKFLEQNNDSDVEYYKFYFADYIDKLNLHRFDQDPALHYFSLGNIMTILELNNTLLKDKVLIFDRSVFSAYVWAQLRERLTEEEAKNEFKKLLHDTTLYENVKVLYMTRTKEPTESRTKDYFDEFDDYQKEDRLFKNLFSEFFVQINDQKRENQLTYFSNDFTEDSVESFIGQLDRLINKKKVLKDV